MTTRAVNLEIAGDFSNDSFILSLRLSIPRHGNVKNIRSDNGTNFTGAEKELKGAVHKINKGKVMTEIIKKDIHSSWKFNPSSSPCMEGAWKSLIKSVQRSLKAVTLDRIFAEETLYTFLCEVEPLLNKRRITPSSDEVNDYEALKRNHLILGNSSSNQLPCKCQNDEIYYRKKMLCSASSIYYVLALMVQGIPTNIYPTTEMLRKLEKSKIRRLSNYTE